MSNTSTNTSTDTTGPRALPIRPDAAQRRGCSIGLRNASAGNSHGNGGSAAPWAYQRRISTMGRLGPRNKQFRAQYVAALEHQQFAGILHRSDPSVAHVMINMTLGGQRDYRVTEAEIARQLPPRADGQAVSKRVASDALDRLRAAGLLDWDHGTSDEFYDPQRRTLLNGRWQGPPVYRLTIPTDVQHMINAREAAARSATMRDKRNGGRHTDQQHHTGATGPLSDREQQRRQAQSNAAAVALLATTTTFADGLTALHAQYGDNSEVFDAASEQFERTWHQARGPT